MSTRAVLPDPWRSPMPEGALASRGGDLEAHCAAAATSSDGEPAVCDLIRSDPAHPLLEAWTDTAAAMVGRRVELVGDQAVVADGLRGATDTLEGWHARHTTPLPGGGDPLSLMTGPHWRLWAQRCVLALDGRYRPGQPDNRFGIGGSGCTATGDVLVVVWAAPSARPFPQDGPTGLWSAQRWADAVLRALPAIMGAEGLATVQVAERGTKLVVGGVYDIEPCCPLGPTAAAVGTGTLVVAEGDGSDDLSVPNTSCAYCGTTRWNVEFVSYEPGIGSHAEREVIQVPHPAVAAAEAADHVRGVREHRARGAVERLAAAIDNLADASGELVSADLARSLHEQDGRLLSAAQADLRDLLETAGLVVLAGGESPTAALEPVARLSPLRAVDGKPPGTLSAEVDLGIHRPMLDVSKPRQWVDIARTQATTTRGPYGWSWTVNAPE